jgi:hypothetical protein
MRNSELIRLVKNSLKIRNIGRSVEKTKNKFEGASYTEDDF